MQSTLDRQGESKRANVCSGRLRLPNFQFRKYTYVLEILRRKNENGSLNADVLSVLNESRIQANGGRSEIVGSNRSTPLRFSVFPK